MSEHILQITDLNKSFGSTHANKNINFSLSRGEVRGLAGENGSGKSTLSSIICGIQKCDSGSMYKDGQKYDPSTPKQANALKVAMVVQELGVVGRLSGAVNMFLGRTDEFSSFGIVNTKKIYKAAQEQLDNWGLGNIPLDCPAEELSIEQRKILELARALSTNPDLLVLDEITQALSHDTRKIIYKLKDRFISEGKTILLITHDMEEMIEICDNITVLRDGEVINTVSCDDLAPDELKSMMIGRKITGDYYRNDTTASYKEDIILEVRELNIRSKLKDISFDLHKGEILGVCGLSGAGIHTLGRAIYGIADNTAGTVMVKTTGKLLKRPEDMIKARGAYLSKDRDSDGLMLSASIKDNLFIPSAKELSAGPWYISRKKTTKLAEDASKAFEIKSTGIGHIVGRLSGGNKQKVNLSRWMIKDLDFIILDCPTRGVDIGVKAYIYDIMKKAKEKGLAILLISDELSEALGMSDRIMVMKDGQITKVISRGSEFSEEAIIEVMI